MVVGAVYGAAHDHDDHATDFEGECVVCFMAALGGAELTPDEPSALAPQIVSVGMRVRERFRLARRDVVERNSARGPPLSVSSD